MQFFTKTSPRPAIDEGPVGKLGFEWWAVKHIAGRLPLVISRCPHEGLRFTSYHAVIAHMKEWNSKLRALDPYICSLQKAIRNHHIYRVEDHEG